MIITYKFTAIKRKKNQKRQNLVSCHNFFTSKPGMTQPLLACAAEIERLLSELEKLALQTVAHRKKFQLAVSQLRKFTDHFQSIATEEEATPQQMDSYRYLIGILRDYNQLFGQHLLHCWAHSVLDNSSSAVPSELCNLVTRASEAAREIDPEGAQALDGQSPQWLQFHLLDLKAIAASLKQYIEGAKPGDKVLPIMTRKLESVDNFLKEYANEDLLPGARVFSPIPINYQTWRLEHSDIVTEREEGSGVSAVVYYGHDKRNGNEVAIKQLKFNKLSGGRLRAFQRELVILATAIHPTLLRFVGATDTAPFCIVTEWMGGGTLYRDLHKHHKLDATKLTICAIDIARGMHFLHSRQIIHRDLKSLNVLLSSDGYAKICDFGFSRMAKKDEVMTQSVGTPHWMAPELLGGQSSYDEKIDVYAYAIVLWEILVKKLPYQGLESSQIVGQVLLNDMRPGIPPTAPPSWRNLIEMCWARDPRSRPPFSKILRILRTGNVLLPGADAAAVMKHIKETTDETERATDDIELELDSQEKAELSKFYATLTRDGIPAELAERCWESLQSMSADQTSELYVKCVAMFLKTTLNAKAAAVLRSLPSGSVPAEVAVAASAMLPTGNESFDYDLVMVACKNGAAEETVLHSLQKEHTKLALETVARIGLQNPENKQGIVQRCLHSLQAIDAMLIVAAYRCLVALNEVKAIPIEIMKTHMQSRNTTVKMATYIVAAKMAEEGVTLPTDFLDAFVAKWEVMPLAGTVLVHACQNIDCARHLINRLMYGSLPPAELVVRILIQASKHNELREELKTTMKQLQIPRTDETVSEALSVLSKQLEL